MSSRLTAILLLFMAVLSVRAGGAPVEDSIDREDLLDFIDGRRAGIVRTGGEMQCSFRYPARPTVDVRIAGRNYQFLVDSGTRLSVLQVSASSGLPATVENVGPAAFLADLDGNRALDYDGYSLTYAEAALVSCGPLRIRNLPMRIYSYEDERPGDFDGSLSLHCLQPYVVAFDNDSLQMTLHDTSDYQPSPGSLAIPVQLLHNMVLLRVTAGERQLLLAVDTGFSGELLLDRDLLSVEGLLEPLGRLNDQGFSGYHGKVTGESAILQELRFNPQPWPGLAATVPSVGLVEVTVIEGLARETALGNVDGILGAGLLSRYNYAFDLGRGVLFLDPR